MTFTKASSTLLSRVSKGTPNRQLVGRISKKLSSSTNDSKDNAGNLFADLSNAELLARGAMFYGMSKGIGISALSVMEKSWGKSALLDKAMETSLQSTVFPMFFGGTNSEQLEGTVRSLAKNNIQTIIDYSPEGNDSANGEFFDNVTKNIISSFQLVKKFKEEGVPDNLLPSVAIKIPASPEIMQSVSEHLVNDKPLTKEEQKEWNAIQKRTLDIFKAANQVSKETDVLVDAEQTWINPAIYALCDMAREKGYNPVETVQCYLKNSPDKMQEIVDRGGSIKLVRGAYMNAERKNASEIGQQDPIFATKNATDENYDSALKKAVSSGNVKKVIVATHNQESAKFAGDLAKEYPDVKITVASLLGMPAPAVDKNVQRALYAPYILSKEDIKGTVAYLRRRAEENGGPAGERGLEAVNSEIQRRKDVFLYGTGKSNGRS